MKKYRVFSKKTCFSFCIFTAHGIYFSVIVYKQFFRKVSHMKKMIVILLAGMLATSVFAADAKNVNAAPATDKTEDLGYDVKKAKEEQERQEKRQKTYSEISCYIPNRLMDVLDMFSIDLKSGAFIGAGFQITKAFGVGGQIGYNAGLYKDFNRQYGIAFENGYQAQLGFMTAEDISIFNPIGNVKTYWQHGNNFPDVNNKIYDRFTGARDYWAIEVYAYCLVGAKVAIHPLEIADFFAGLICKDPKKDDFKLKLY